MSPKKKKSFLSTWIVLGIFIVLGFVAVYLDRGDKLDRNKIKIFELEKEDIRSFEIVNSLNGETVLCEKNGNDWAMVTPKAYEIEKTETDAVVTNLAALSIDRKLEKPGPLADYGLEKPAVTVNFTLKNGKKKALLVGDKNPTGTFYYVKDKDSAELYVGYSFSIETVLKSAGDLRRKTLFKIDTEKVDRVDLKYELKEFSLAKTEDKKWLIEPYGFRANSGEVESFLAGIKELKAKSIIEDSGTELKKYGLNAPRLTLTTSITGQNSVKVLIGKKHLAKEEDYAKIDDSAIIYSIDSAFLKGADKKYNDFRDKKLLFLTEKDINEVELVKGKKKIVAKKGANGKYAITEPAGVKDAEAVYAALIKSVLALETKSFVDDSGKKLENYGLTNPRAVLTLYNTENNGKKIKAKIELGDFVNSEYYVKIDNNDSVFLVTGTLAEGIKEIEKAAETKK